MYAQKSKAWTHGCKEHSSVLLPTDIRERILILNAMIKNTGPLLYNIYLTLIVWH